MRIVEQPPIKVFLFNELTASAQEKAINDYNLDVDYNWHDDLIAYFDLVLEKIGFSNLSFEYSGFWQQGSGACFVGDYRYEKGMKKNLKEFLTSEFSEENKNKIMAIVDKLLMIQKKHAYRITATIYKNNHMYSHENTMSIETLKDVYDPYENELSYEEDRELLDIFKNLAQVFYSILEKEYEAITSEEHVRYNLESDCFEFLENGKMYYS